MYIKFTTFNDESISNSKGYDIIDEVGIEAVKEASYQGIAVYVDGIAYYPTLID